MNTQTSKTPIDPQKFQQMIRNVDNSKLQQLAQLARLQGISQVEIEKGLDSIQQLKNQS